MGEGRGRLDGELLRRGVPARDEVSLERNAGARRSGRNELGEGLTRSASEREQRELRRGRRGWRQDRIELVRKHAEVVVDSRRELAQKREELSPDANAEKPRVPVGGVDRRGDLVAREMGVDRGAGGAKEGADQLPRAGRERGEAAWASATEQAKEDGFGAVFTMMGGRDDRASTAGCGRTEGVVTQGSCASLEVAAGGHAHDRPVERDVERARQLLGEIELPRGFGP